MIELNVWTNAEITVCIIAASIPVLRVLLKDVKSTLVRYGYGGSSSGNSRSRGETFQKSNNRATVLAVKSKNSSGSRMDDDSEKDILEFNGMGQGHSGILQKNEFAIEFDNLAHADERPGRAV